MKSAVELVWWYALMGDSCVGAAARDARERARGSRGSALGATSCDVGIDQTGGRLLQPDALNQWTGARDVDQVGRTARPKHKRTSFDKLAASAPLEPIP